MSVLVETPQGALDCACVLVDGYGNVHLLEEDGAYPPSTLNVFDWKRSGVLGDLSITSPDVELLELHHVFYDQMLKDGYAGNVHDGVVFHGDDKGAYITPQGSTLVLAEIDETNPGWVSRRFDMRSDLLIGGESFFGALSVEPALRLPRPGPRLRPSSLSARAC